MIAPMGRLSQSSSLSVLTACRPPVSARGMVLLECLLALLILSIVILGLTCATTTGNQHLQYSDKVFRAVRLGEQLLEEIESRPYTGHGANRLSYHIDDYNGFHEEPGDLMDCVGNAYGAKDQIFSRSASISAGSHVITALENAAIPGKTVVATVRDTDGTEWQLSRFVAEPVSP